MGMSFRKGDIEALGTEYDKGKDSTCWDWCPFTASAIGCCCSTTQGRGWMEGNIWSDTRTISGAVQDIPIDKKASRVLSSKLSFFFFIMMGCSSQNSAATGITSSTQLKKWGIILGLLTHIRAQPTDWTLSVMYGWEGNTTEKEKKPPKFGKPVCWHQASHNTYVLARNKMVTETKCHLWVVDTSKIMPCIPCYATNCWAVNPGKTGVAIPLHPTEVNITWRLCT